MRMNGSEIIINVLLEQGVDTIFGYPGGAILNVYDALYRHSDQIKHHLTAHEQGAAHAADGYARVTGKTGVVFATSGPGATNLVTGIATAYMDSIPMVALTCNVGSSLIGKDSFQEVYSVGITMPITKHNYTVQKVEDLADTLRDAVRIAGSGRRGPVLVDVTKDVTMAEYDYTPKPGFAEKKKPLENDEEIWEILRYMGRASRPLVCYGGGIVSSGASEQVYELCHKAQIPAVHTIMASGIMSWDDPLNLGLAGMHGRYSCNRAIDNADLILAVGFRFSDRVALNTKRFAPKAKIVQIDIDPSEVNKNVQVDHSVIGDTQMILQKLLPMIEGGGHEAWIAEINEWRKQDFKPKDSDQVIKPHQLIEKMSEMAGEDAVIVTDVGQHQMWACQYAKRTKPRSFLTSGGLGTMGFGYGAAIGAQVAVGDGRRVVHITGDGSFHMNMNECCTAVSYELPVISVILNNCVLGMVRLWQTSFYENRYSATTLDRKTNYVMVAEGFGAKGFRATTLAEFEAAFAEALKIKGRPVWIECVIDRDEMVYPMIPAGGTVDDTIMN